MLFYLYSKLILTHYSQLHHQLVYVQLYETTHQATVAQIIGQSDFPVNEDWKTQKGHYLQ